MAIPVAPGLAELAAESLAKAGIQPSQHNYPFMLARATTRWIEEVKNDIWQTVGASYNRRLKSLQSTNIQIGVVGKSQYNMPSDFEDVLDISILGTTRTQVSSYANADVALGSTRIWIPAITDLVSSGIGIGDVANILLDSGEIQSSRIVDVAPVSGAAATYTVSAGQTITVGSTQILLTNGMLVIQAGAVLINNGIVVSEYVGVTDWYIVIADALTSSVRANNAITFSTAVKAASSNTVMLSGGETGTSTTLIGKSIMLTSGAGAAQLRQIIRYNDQTHNATLSSAWDTVPAVGDTYIIADKPMLMSEFSEIELDFPTVQLSNGIPRQFTDYQGLITFDRPFDQVYGIRTRYFANIHKLDSTGTVVAGIYQNWQEVLIQGMYLKALQSMNAKEYVQEFQVYKAMLQDLIARENPWVDGTDQISVDPWVTPFRGLTAASLSVGRY